MAKSPETIDRFEVITHCTKDQLGHAMAALMTAGIPAEQIQSRMVTDVLNYKVKPKHDTSGIDFARAFIDDHPTFTRADAIKHFRDHGRTDTACTGALWRLREEGIIRKLDGGNYQRKDVKAIAGPKQAKANGKAKVRVHAPKSNNSGNMRGRTHTNYDTPNNDFLLSKLRTRKSMTSHELEKYFEENGRKKKSVGSLLTVLTQLHKVRRLEQGVYAAVVVNKVKKVKLTPRIPVTKPNGSAVEAQAGEAVNNG